MHSPFNWTGGRGLTCKLRGLKIRTQLHECDLPFAVEVLALQRTRCELEATEIPNCFNVTIALQNESFMYRSAECQVVDDSMIVYQLAVYAISPLEAHTLKRSNTGLQVAGGCINAISRVQLVNN